MARARQRVIRKRLERSRAESPVSHALTPPSIGDVVDGKFRVHRKLGEGGTSTIYEVRHAITDKSFAIKWLSPELAQNELAVERFVYEAKVCGRYVHPNAVQI